MLPNDSAPDRSPLAADVRVTHQELVEAVAALEARQEQARLLERNTIPIGEAVEQLNLNTTPEELLAEVQARRVRKISTTLPASGPRPRRRLLPTFLCLFLAANTIFLIRALNTERDMNMPATSAFSEAPARNTMAIPDLSVDDSAESTPVVPPAVMREAVDPEVPSLANVPENKTVYAPITAICDLAEGRSPAKVPVSLQKDENNLKNWRIIKFRGQTFVRGWADKSSDAAREHSAFSLRAWIDTNEIFRYDFVSVPISRFKNLKEPPVPYPIGGEYSERVEVPAR